MTLSSNVLFSNLFSGKGFVKFLDIGDIGVNVTGGVKGWSDTHDPFLIVYVSADNRNLGRMGNMVESGFPCCCFAPGTGRCNGQNQTVRVGKGPGHCANGIPFC